MSLEPISVLLLNVAGVVESAVRRAIAPLEYMVGVAQDCAGALRRLEAAPEGRFVIVMDIDTSNSDTLHIVREIRRQAPDSAIILTGQAPDPAAIVPALKNGASDFVQALASEEEWRKAIVEAANDGASVPAAAPAPAGSRTGAYLGNSPGMTAIDSALKQIASSDVPVLIQGETGSGKEVLARELHANSARAKYPFFKLNCAALPSELVESELFGYEKGSFTGAFQRKLGIFEAANQGTILLDEIGDMDVRLQAKLLQVLQDQAFQRIGGKEPIRVDVRVIAATHRDLEAAIRDGNFREDLFYRLNVVNLVVPPLRERKDDLFDLFDVLLRKHAKGEPAPALTEELRTAMLEWDWPGNVRELENFVRRLLVFRNCAYLARELRQLAWNRKLRDTSRNASLISPAIGVPVAKPVSADVNPPGSENARFRNLAEVTSAQQKAEAETILAALNATRWNRRTAAALLNVDYKGLLYRMKKLGLDQKKPQSGAEDVRVERLERSNLREFVRAAAAAV